MFIRSYYFLQTALKTISDQNRVCYDNYLGSRTVEGTCYDISSMSCVSHVQMYEGLFRPSSFDNVVTAIIEGHRQLRELWNDNVKYYISRNSTTFKIYK